MNKIREKERDAIIQSLGAGVDPRIGQRLIQVGRLREVEAYPQRHRAMRGGRIRLPACSGGIWLWQDFLPQSDPFDCSGKAHGDGTCRPFSRPPLALVRRRGKVPLFRADAKPCHQGKFRREGDQQCRRGLCVHGFGGGSRKRGEARNRNTLTIAIPFGNELGVGSGQALLGVDTTRATRI